MPTINVCRLRAPGHRDRTSLESERKRPNAHRSDCSSAAGPPRRQGLPCVPAATSSRARHPAAVDRDPRSEYRGCPSRAFQRETAASPLAASWGHRPGPGRPDLKGSTGDAVRALQGGDEVPRPVERRRPWSSDRWAFPRPTDGRTRTRLPDRHRDAGRRHRRPNYLARAGRRRMFSRLISRRPRQQRRVRGGPLATSPTTVSHGRPTLRYQATSARRTTPPVPLISSAARAGNHGARHLTSGQPAPARGRFAVISPEGHGRVLPLHSWGWGRQIDDLANMQYVARRPCRAAHPPAQRLPRWAAAWAARKRFLLVKLGYNTLLAGAVAPSIRRPGSRAASTATSHASPTVVPSRSWRAGSRRAGEVTRGVRAAQSHQLRPRNRLPRGCRCRCSGAWPARSCSTSAQPRIPLPANRS